MSWKYPDLRDGTTICVFADPQMGYRPWTQEQLERVGKDLDALAPYCHGVVNVGDTIHWSLSGAEDELALPWLAARKQNMGVPWAMVAGNHDLSTFSGYDPHPNRSADQWGLLYGQQKNTVTPMGPSFKEGPLTVIGISPDRWDYKEPDGYGPMVIPAHTVDWLERQLVKAAPAPCIVVTHIPLPEHDYAGEMVRPPHMVDVLARHQNIVGWLSGHRHAPYTRANNTMTLTFGANRFMSLNAPSTGGKTGGTDGATRFDDEVMTTWVTYRDGTFHIRWRDHLNARWAAAGDGYVRTISI